MSNATNSDVSNRFVYWQCQIRKHSARELEYRPTSGIYPALFLDEEKIGHVITLLVPRTPAHDISQLQHIYNKTYDPNKRREGALKYLQSEFYQVPAEFNGELTVLAAKKASWVDSVLQAAAVRLVFEQDSRQWQLPCNMQLLADDDLRWQFTLAHNQLFSHALTNDIQVLHFNPVWDSAKENSLVNE